MPDIHPVIYLLVGILVGVNVWQYFEVRKYDR